MENRLKLRFPLSPKYNTTKSERRATKMKLQQLVEEKVSILIIFTLLVVSVGLLIEVIPLFFSPTVTQPIEGVKPYNDYEIGRASCRERV